MLKNIFDKEELCYFSNHRQETPLHWASGKKHLGVIKYLIEKGADVNSHWSEKLLKRRMNVLTLVNNFNDPFYQCFNCQIKHIEQSQMSILIENGMI